MDSWPCIVLNRSLPERRPALLSIKHKFPLRFNCRYFKNDQYDFEFPGFHFASRMCGETIHSMYLFYFS